MRDPEKVRAHEGIVSTVGTSCVHGRRRRYGQYGSCRATFEWGSAKLGICRKNSAKNSGKNSQRCQWFILVNLTHFGPYVILT